MGSVLGLALAAAPVLAFGESNGDPWVGRVLAAITVVGLTVWFLETDPVIDSVVLSRLCKGFCSGVGALMILSLIDGATAPVSGVVIDRDYSPEHTSSSTSCTTTATGQTSCFPSTTHHPESWSLLLRDPSDNGWWRDETGWRTVSEAQHDRCRVGDRYPACAEGAADAD
ncbi:hypothetical protein DEF23_12745 [Marinitenerispora sediminis]|uniref:Uncharacterized protein n=1 Tax=Marinitenerispora sediminis TaxID=1931232 RepID=A0A368T555_9ACTN|nr:hypothetical protein DEF23_12745 [Marinitenerispora sediminis]RCV57417.1 hypothetical protein DEF28_01510 [Marinitenerispora sediminis]RCV58711.1 hypothetical protein DEF24_12575 [Marinitenerispora sediminis]